MHMVLTTILIGIIFSVFALSGCGEDDPTDTVVPILPLDVTGILISPKAPAPGDTVQITAVVVSDTVNLEYPSYSWSSSGGVFLESNQVSVRWIAPLNSAIYSISITASNSVNSSSLSSAVFIGLADEIISDEAGEMHVSAAGDEILYLSSPLDPADPLFVGFLVNLYTVGGGVIPLTSDFRGTDYVFSRDLNLAVHTVETRLGGTVIENPIDVILSDAQAGTQTQITSDNMTPADVRHTQHRYPTLSPDNNLITFQVFRPHPAPGNVDTIDVAVYDRMLAREINVTGTHGTRRKNYYPSFSSDGNWLVFVTDRSSQLEWELYGLPISGGTVATDSADIVRLTDTGGTIAAELIPNNPLKEWNPNSSYPTIAIKDANNFLRLIDVNSGSNVTVPLPAEANNFKWSPDGQKLAISTKVNLYLLDFTGGVVGNTDLIVQGSQGDQISNISWSADNDYIAFLVARSGSIWYEVFDVGGATGLNSSVIVTPSYTQGSLGSYAGVMSAAPQLAPDLSGTGRILYFLLFDGLTPRMLSLDLSGALP
jgi:Tol biopolymer transport system component